MAQSQTTNGKGASVDTEDLAQQIETLKTDLKDLTSVIAGVGQTKVAEVRGAAEDTLRSARDAGVEKVEHVRAQAEQMGDDARQFVQCKPATAIGVAVGMGFLIGLLGRGR